MTSFLQLGLHHCSVMEPAVVPGPVLHSYILSETISIFALQGKHTYSSARSVPMVAPIISSMELTCVVWVLKWCFAQKTVHICPKITWCMNAMCVLVLSSVCLPGWFFDGDTASESEPCEPCPRGFYKPDISRDPYSHDSKCFMYCDEFVSVLLLLLSRMPDIPPTWLCFRVWCVSSWIQHFHNRSYSNWWLLWVQCFFTKIHQDCHSFPFPTSLASFK